MVSRDTSIPYFFRVMAKSGEDHWQQVEVKLNIIEVEGLLRDFGLYNFVKDDELPDEAIAKRLDQYIDLNPDINEEIYTIHLIKKNQESR